MRKYGPKGTWALVTGASDGIGKEFATQLSQKGFNLLLVSRTASKLSTLAHDLETKNGVKTKTLAMDFSVNNDADYAKLKALVDGLDIGILVNNVGLSHDMPVTFLQTPDKEMKDIITINVMGTLRVTHIVAPGMAQRKRGLIITMGSFGGLLPNPMLATYSGSKAFLQHWSSALGAELKPKGVDVEFVLSYMVTSAMSKIRKTSAFVPNPRQFVKATLRTLGLGGGSQGRAYTSTPYWSHGIMQWWLENAVGLLNVFTVKQSLKMHEDIQRRVFRKRERDAKKGL